MTTDYVQPRGVELNLSWVGDYKSSVEGKGFTVRGSNSSFYSVGKSLVNNIDCVAQGFLLGALYARGKKLEEVTFYPADTVTDVNTHGKPVYVLEFENHYELETHFQ